MNIRFEETVELLHTATYGVLATQSTQLSGYPFASVLPLTLDERHCPIFLMSTLAEHTKNADADRRASLLIANLGESDPLANPRLSLLGDMNRFEPNADLLARVLRYQPEADRYLQLGGFGFFRFQPKRARYIAGFGKMGWVEETDWSDCAILSLTEEQQLMQNISTSENTRILGIDCYGVDMIRDDKRHRIDFSNSPLQSKAIAETLQNILAQR